MHLQKNIIDSFEYNQRIEMTEKALQRSPNKLEEVEKLEQSIIFQPSTSATRSRQVMLRSKSNEHSTSVNSKEAKSLIIKLQNEKKEREMDKQK